MNLHDSNTIVKLVQEYGMLLEKYPNQRSMHSCGIIISEEPITNYTPLEMPPKGFPIVLFDMHIAEDSTRDFKLLSLKVLFENTAVKSFENLFVDLRTGS